MLANTELLHREGSLRCLPLPEEQQRWGNIQPKLGFREREEREQKHGGPKVLGGLWEHPLSRVTTAPTLWGGVQGDAVRVMSVRAQESQQRVRNLVTPLPGPRIRTGF